MRQTSFQTDDIFELEEYFRGVARSRDFRLAKSVLVQLYVEGWDPADYKAIIETVRRILPKAKVCASTNVNREVFVFQETFEKQSPDLVDVVANILYFERSNVDICAYELGDTCDRGAGAAFSSALCRISDPKAVMLLANMEFDVDGFLSMAVAMNDEIPFFGSLAGGIKGEYSLYSTFTDKAMSHGIVSDGERLITAGIVCVIFSGEDLHIRAGYNFGWTPIGKKMTITKMEGDYLVKEIDGEPAENLYKKYLGLSRSQITSQNICEFPLSIERGERLMARIGESTVNEGDLLFSASVFEGDELRLTYGNPSTILQESFGDSMSVYGFCPQALILVACMNRSVLLRETVEVEKGFYTRICPDPAVQHGNAEILFDEKGGGVLNPALVSIAMREGTAEEVGYVDIPPEQLACHFEEENDVPLVRRFMTFLEATTNDLARALISAKEANRAKSDFLSSVSHEIRTPINAVLGMDEMILRESNEENIRHYAFDIKNAGRILLSLINDLLDSSRIDAGRMELIPVEYELSSALNDLVNMISFRAKEKNLDLHVRVDKNTPSVLLGDDTRLRQCAINILTNAVKYTREGSVTMEISFEKVDNAHIKLRFSVTDTGIGIRKEDIDKLFKPYERIEERRNRAIEGTGLGMSIVKALLTLMDSELEVESVYGEGSTFSFSVLQKVISWEPIGDFNEMYERSIETAESYREAFRAPEARILVVDDTAMNLTVIKGLLKETKIRIDTAPGGREAIGLVQRVPYDVIFLDQRMPEMDGIETLRRMKHLFDSPNRDTPVIMLTANAVAGAREMFLDEGFNDYLTKPINGKKLEQTLMSFIPDDKIIAGRELEELENDEWYAASASEEKRDLSSLKSALAEIPGMDVQAALENCMNEEILEETIRDFLEGAKKNPDTIERYLKEGDLKNYTILVHALKSSSRIIGLGELSSFAERMEACGDAGDEETIRRETPQLVRDYRKAAERLTKAIAREGGSSSDDADGEDVSNASAPKEEIPREQIDGAFAAVREFIEAFDYDGAADVLAMLKGFLLPQKVQEKLEQLESAIRRLDRDEILKHLENN